MASIDATGLLECREAFAAHLWCGTFCAVGIVESVEKNHMDLFHADCVAARQDDDRRFGEMHYTMGSRDQSYECRYLAGTPKGGTEFATVFWGTSDYDFASHCGRALSSLPLKIAECPPVFEHADGTTGEVGAFSQWCRLVFRKLRNVGSYVREFQGDHHRLLYLTVGLFQASVRTIDILLENSDSTTELGKSPPMTEAQQKAFDYIKDHGPKTGKEICKALDISSESSFTRHTVPALKQHGIKNRAGSGYYLD